MPCSVSVIIPTFNRAWSLHRALGSVQVQTLPPSEIVVVDDGSSDGTSGVGFSAGNHPIRWLRIDFNSGVSVARNLGIAEARGDLIAFLDSDDEWAPRKLEYQVACLDRAGVGAVSCGLTIRSPHGAERTWVPTRNRTGGAGLIEEYDAASMWLFRRSALLQLGEVFDPAMRYGQMREMLQRLSAVCEFGSVPHSLAIIHDHDHAPRNTKSAARVKLASYKRLVEKHADTVNSHPALMSRIEIVMARWTFEAENPIQARALLRNAVVRHPRSGLAALRALIRYEILSRPSRR